MLVASTLRLCRCSRCGQLFLGRGQPLLQISSLSFGAHSPEAEKGLGLLAGLDHFGKGRNLRRRQGGRLRQGRPASQSADQDEAPHGMTLKVYGVVVVSRHTPPLGGAEAQVGRPVA